MICCECERLRGDQLGLENGNEMEKSGRAAVPAGASE